jgi:hypothetical protein
MGEKLSQYFEAATAMGGIKAKMRLAALTCLPGQAAATAPDSPENIAKFEKAMEEIKWEFQQGGVAQGAAR